MAHVQRRKTHFSTFLNSRLFGDPSPDSDPRVFSASLEFNLPQDIPQNCLFVQSMFVAGRQRVAQPAGETPSEASPNLSSGVEPTSETLSQPPTTIKPEAQKSTFFRGPQEIMMWSQGPELGQWLTRSVVAWPFFFS